MLNVSAGGVRVALDHAIDPGAELDVELEFGAERISRERAKVVWVRALPDGFLAGLAFAR